MSMNLWGIKQMYHIFNISENTSQYDKYHICDMIILRPIIVPQTRTIEYQIYIVFIILLKY